MSESFSSGLIAFLQAHEWLAAPLVFVLGFAEGIPVISLFVPSSVLFLGVGSLLGAAGGNFWTIWLSAAAGATLGDCTTYLLGRYYKDEAVNLWPFSRYPDWLVKARAFLEKWGVLAVFAGKFLGFMRPFMPVAAGALQMHLLLFILANALSSLVWAGVFLAPGWGLGRVMQ